MKVWMWCVLLFGLLSTLIFGLIYQYGGLKYWVKANSYVKNDTETRNMLYGFTESGVYGGIIAGVWQNRIGIWGKKGLKIFKTEDNLKYTFVTGCNKRLSLDNFFVSEFTNIRDWSIRIKQGDYAFIKNENNNRIVWGSDFWPFINDTVEEQCKRR